MIFYLFSDALVLFPDFATLMYSVTFDIVLFPLMNFGGGGFAMSHCTEEICKSISPDRLKSQL